MLYIQLKLVNSHHQSIDFIFVQYTPNLVMSIVSDYKKICKKLHQEEIVLVAVCISLSPLPERLIIIISSFDIVGAIFITREIA